MSSSILIPDAEIVPPAPTPYVGLAIHVVSGDGICCAGIVNWVDDKGGVSATVLMPAPDPSRPGQFPPIMYANVQGSPIPYSAATKPGTWHEHPPACRGNMPAAEAPRLIH